MRLVAHNGARVWGGGEKWPARLLAGLQERGHEVLFIANDDGVAERAAAFGIPTRVVHLGGDLMLPHAVRLARHLRDFEADAVLLSTFKKSFLAGLGARLAGVRRIVGRSSLSTDVPRSAKYRYLFRSDWLHGTVFNADAIRVPFVARLPGADPRRFITIYDATLDREPERDPELVRRELGIPEGAPVVGAVARLAEQKRFDRFLEALAALPETVHGLLVGDGPERDALTRTARELGVTHRLHMPGFRPDVADVLRALDVFVVSSDREGMANAMLEALAAGRPVVSTPVSGAAEALDADGGTPAGLIVEADAGALAGALAGLLTDEDRRRTMGAAARRRARERFGVDRMVDRWEALFRGVALPTLHEGPTPVALTPEAARRLEATWSAPGRPDGELDAEARR